MSNHTNPDRLAPAPTRATTSITLSAGALVFPLSIYTAVSDLSVRRSERLGGDPSITVGRTTIRRDTGDVVDHDNVTRMAQAVSGKAAGDWVIVTDDDLASVYGDTGEATIVSFVPIADAGRYVLDGLLQVRPKADKRKAAQSANEQAFSLLLAGMVDRGVHALIRFVMRGGPRFGLLTADGDLFTIISADAVREAKPLATHNHDQAALDMIGQFIDVIGVGSEPVIDDTPTKVQSFVDAKAVEHGVAEGESPVTTTQSAPASVSSPDVMAALEASIAEAKAARKPVKKAAKKSAARRRKAVAK